MWVVAAVALVAVVAREGDAAGDQANRAQYAQRGECGLVGAQRLRGDDFAGERMFRRARDRIAGKAAVFLHADQRALAALMQEAGWRGVGYKNLSGGIVAVHRATRAARPRDEEQ